MSFVTALRDYVDVLNATTFSLGGNLTFQEFLTQTIIYSFQTLWVAFIYLISGQWIRDLAFLPIKAPQISSSVIKEGYVAALTPFSNTLSFSETIFSKSLHPFLFFFIGFLNSFFASLPISSAHLISGRQLLVHGIPAGVASGFGTLIGQLFFLTCVLFGLRPLVIPWVSFQPWSAFLSFAILIYTVYGFAQKESLERVKGSEFTTFRRFFFINFILSWCEQSAFFHHLGNVTLFPSASQLESFSGFSSFPSYLLGFLLGSCFFGVAFIALALFSKHLLLNLTTLPLATFFQGINFFFTASLIGLCFCTFPFYGLDLLFGKPFGILPQERSLRGTVLSPNRLSHIESSVTSEDRFYLNKQGDLTPWDTGFYLQEESFYDLEGKRVETKENPFLQFPSLEELNIEAHYAWTNGRPTRLRIHKDELNSSVGESLREFLFPKGANVEINEQKKVRRPFFPSSEQGKDEEKSYLDSQHFQQSWSDKDKNGITIQEYYENPGKGLGWRPLFKEDDSEINLFKKRKKRDISGIKERAKEELEIDSFLLNNHTLSLSPFFIYDPPSPERESLQELEKIIKERFYNTIAYKRALNFDIDLFVSRQPKKYLLSQQEETELLEKRQSLSKYYDTLRDYKKMSVSDFNLFKNYFGGSKSYATKFYNQQFKGTLKIVRKLFSIHLGDELAFSPLTFDQPLFLDKGKESDNFHEELFNQHEKFLKGAGSRPLYAGWDEQSKKFLLTNRFLSRSLAGKELLISKDEISNYPTLKSLSSLTFASWPMPKIMFLGSKDLDQLPNNYNLMCQKNPLPDEDDIDEEMILWRMETNPTNYGPPPSDSDSTKYIWKIFPPDRGGILWPGSKKIEFNIKDLF